jgi:hypothetical protein
MKNTRIHQPREMYEKHISDEKIAELNINDPHNVNYMKKYLKYKMKYLTRK